MPDLEIPRYEDMDTQVQWSSAFAAAIAAHALLILALTFGLHWNKSTESPVFFEAEIWAEVPEERAPGQSQPKRQTPEPQPQPEPEPAPPEPEPAPALPPEVKQPDPPVMATGDIALKKAKEEQARLEEERQAQLALKKAEQERLAKEKAEKARQERERLAKAKAEKARQEKLAQEKAEKERIAKAKAEKARQAKLAREKARREQLAKEKAEKARQEKLAREKARQERIAQEKAEQARLEAVTQKMREEQLKRTAGLAGGGSTQGKAAVAKGPSKSYGSKVVAAVKPNIIYTGRLDNRLSATVEVTTAPSGEIIGRRLVQSSGNPGWDQAVLRAVDRTNFLPLDEDGRIPSPMQIKFSPND